MSIDLESANRKVVKHVVLIDSADRDTNVFKQGAYTIMLPQEYREVRKVRLVTAEVPFSFYINTAANATTSLVLSLAGGLPQTCTIPDGSYTTLTLGSAISLAVANNPVFKAQHFTVTILIDPATLKMTLTGTSAFTMDTTHSTSASASAWGLPYFMGFAPNLLYTSDAISFTLTGPKMTNTMPINNIILSIDNLNFMDETQVIPLGKKAFGGFGNHRSAFAKIPLTAAPFGLNLFSAGDSHYNEVLLNPLLGKLDRVQIAWHHHDGTTIDFNDIDHSLTLEIECIERIMV